MTSPYLKWYGQLKCHSSKGLEKAPFSYLNRSAVPSAIPNLCGEYRVLCPTDNVGLDAEAIQTQSFQDLTCGLRLSYS